MNKNIIISLNKESNLRELSKLIGYASEEIISFKFEGDNLIVETEDATNEEDIINKITYIINKHVETTTIEEIIFSNVLNDQNYTPENKILESDLVKIVDKGLISLTDKAVAIFNYFDSVFLELASSIGCIEKIYPVLLPVNVYKNTGYLKSSPQYAIFCCDLEENISKIKNADTLVSTNSINDILKQPKTALSPSACFHVYHDIENNIFPLPFSLTFKQNVFRNEGRFNWKRYGCLKSYHIREIVFIGSEDYVRKQRNKMLNLAIEFLREINIKGTISTSSDPFIVPEYQKVKNIQIAEKSKYELRLNYNNIDSLACASFNYHGISFSKPFNFKVLGGKSTVSGCIGFGLERWVLAFLSQYGIDDKLWPGFVKDKIKGF